VAVWENRDGEPRLQLAHCLGALGAVEYAQGRYGAAKEHAEQALSIRREFLDADHPEVAVSMSQLATSLVDLGRMKEAEAMYRHAIQSFEKRLGPDAPALPWVLIRLFSIRAMSGDAAEAEALLKRALAIREKRWRPDHPEIAGSLIELAKFYITQGRPSEAEPFARRAIAIMEKAELPSGIVPALDVSARILSARDAHDEAEALFRRALTIRERKLPDDDRQLAELLEHYAGFLGNLRRLEDARPIEARARAIRERFDCVEPGSAR
jgi:tetratricopeptide (TPR) repeat protein